MLICELWGLRSGVVKIPAFYVTRCSDFGLVFRRNIVPPSAVVKDY
jgi:hypothetical protein